MLIPTSYSEDLPKPLNEWWRNQPVSNPTTKVGPEIEITIDQLIVPNIYASFLQ
jgi:hypothetical protein